MGCAGCSSARPKAHVLQHICAADAAAHADIEPLKAVAANASSHDKAPRVTQAATRQTARWGCLSGRPVAHDRAVRRDSGSTRAAQPRARAHQAGNSAGDAAQKPARLVCAQTRRTSASTNAPKYPLAVSKTGLILLAPWPTAVSWLSAHEARRCLCQRALK